MIPVTQRIVASGWGVDADGKAEVPGDCVKACVASVLELAYEDVPHFVAGEVVDPNVCGDGTPHPDGPRRLDWFSGLRHWMRARGYSCVPVHRSYFKHVDCQMAWARERTAAGIRDTTGRDCLWMYDAREDPPWHEGYWIASVISENIPGATHAIVMRGGEVAHDPSPRERRSPYRYVGEMVFVAPDPQTCRAR